MPLGEIIRSKRIEKGMTVEELGAKIGVSKTTVSRWETGVIKRIMPSHRVALTAVLGFNDQMICDYSDIIDGYRTADETIKRAIRILLKIDK